MKKKEAVSVWRHHCPMIFLLLPFLRFDFSMD